MTHSPDPARVYRNTHEGLVALAATLDEDRLATVVPTCPDWTVQDVYAHLAGLARDILEGRVGHPVSDGDTARQVASFAGHTIAEITAVWAEHIPAVEALITALGRAGGIVAADAWTHSQDIYNALGLVADREGDAVDLMVLGVWRLKRTLRDAGVAPLRVVTGDTDWVIGDTDPAATLRIEPYELARALLGRRSLAQMRSYDWDGDPAPYLPLIPAFTPPASAIVE